MDGPTVMIVTTSVNGIALGVVIFAVKKIITTSLKALERRLDCEKDDRVKVDNELWAAVNSHGHKGLDENNARVTR